MSNPSFDRNSTAQEVAEYWKANIKGKNVVVTGATGEGLGYETARVVAPYAHLVIMCGRGESRLNENRDKILKETSSANIKCVDLDLGSPSSVQAAAKQINEMNVPVDVLVNNAGVMACDYAKSQFPEVDVQLGTNHLGHFLFTSLLKDRIFQSSSPRIVNVSSGAHQIHGIKFDDIGFSEGKTYNKFVAYGQAKTANALFSVGLRDRYAKDGLTTFSLHPGTIYSGVFRHMPIDEQKAMGFADENGKPLVSNDRFTWKTVEQGASTHIVAAFDDSIKENGTYLVDCQLAPKEGKDSFNPWASSSENAERLWQISEKLVGRAF